MDFIFNRENVKEKEEKDKIEKSLFNEISENEID